MTERGITQVDPWSKWGWLLAVVWIVFLYFPIRALQQSDAHPVLVVIGAAAMVVFTASYLAGFVLGMRAGWRQPSLIVRVFFVVAVVSALLTIPAIGWGVGSFVPFLMAYASYGFTTLWHWIMIVVGITVVSLDLVRSLVSGETPPWFLLGVVLLMSAVNTINVWLIDRSVAAEQLRITLATSTERESIARDVHDLLGHSLTVVKLKAQLAARLVDTDPEGAKRELTEIARVSGEALDGVRGTVTGVRAGDKRAPLERQLGTTRDTLTSQGVEVSVTGTVDSLSPAQALPAAWILKEATTNILRHADARRVNVTLEPGTLTVEDDGVGIPSGSPMTGGSDTHGIRGMRERAAQAGATLSVEAAKDFPSGTRVSVVW